MPDDTCPDPFNIDLGWALRPYPGLTVCGDAVEIRTEHLFVSVALADGLGHGPEAALAADLFCHVVRDSTSRVPEQMLREAHSRLIGTRGVAAAVLCFDIDNARAQFSGVGNIDLRARSCRPMNAFSLPGVVGGMMRKTKQFDLTLTEGDLLVLFSDGISSRFDFDELGDGSAQQMADALLARQAKAHDDASCVVIRFGATR